MNPPTSTGATAKKPAAGKAKRGGGVTPPSRRGGSGVVLTDVIVDLGLVEREAMDEAIEMAHSAGSAAERVLVSTGAITEDQLARAVAERFGLDHLDLQLYRVEPDAAKLVSPAAIKRYQAVPVAFAGDRTLLVAMADPANVLAVDDIAVMTGYEVRPAVASPADIESVLDRLEDPDWGGGGGAAPGRRGPGAPSRRRSRRRRRSTTSARDRQLRRRRRGRLGHRARPARHQRGRRPRRVRHPLRAARGGDAGPLPRRRRAARGGDRPGLDRPRGHLADQDPRRPRHRRAARAAGRPRHDEGLRQGDRPPRRHAPGAVRRERRDAHPGLVEGADRDGAARHAAAGARALHQGDPASRTAPCS